MMNDAATFMFDLSVYLSTKRQLVNAALECHLSQLVPSGHIIEAMRYVLLGNGKRVRPLLCLAGAEAVGGALEAALPCACAIEMIHTYSLIHDDLPAMDNDDLRRGRATCHKAFDEATAILAGDALLTLAFEVLASADSLSPATNLKVIQRIARAAGCTGMIEGQMQDMAAEGQHLTLEQLEAMHRLKTGALIEVAVHSGALAGGGDERQIQCLQRYGQALGLAFQVADDILNVEGDPQIMGKAVGTDGKRRKNTYPLLLGARRAKDLAASLVNKALQALADFDTKADPLRAIATYTITRKR